MQTEPNVIIRGGKLLNAQAHSANYADILINGDTIVEIAYDKYFSLTAIVLGHIPISIVVIFFTPILPIPQLLCSSKGVLITMFLMFFNLLAQ